MLDDLFIRYLSDVVGPFTYGSEWILIGEPFDTRIACPIEWVADPSRSIVELSPSWLARTTLAAAGLSPGSYWAVASLAPVERRGCYGLVTNNPDVARLAADHAKAVAFLARRGQFLFSTPSDVATDEFQFRMVFRDWLTVAPGKILVDHGGEVSPKLLEMFKEPG